MKKYVGILAINPKLKYKRIEKCYLLTAHEHIPMPASANTIVISAIMPAVQVNIKVY